MAKSNFWVNLLKKILKIILKNLGVSSRPTTKNQHVVPHEEGWAIKGEGNEKYTAIYDIQEDAIRRAKTIAKSYKSDVIIHRTDGTIRDRVSYD
jgi:exo-beta-1,3-glucanase (GH17 family)